MNDAEKIALVYTLLKDRTGLLFGDDVPSDDWFEGVSEKIFRSVHVRIPHLELQDILQNSNINLLTDEFKHAIATYLSFTNWEAITIDSIDMKQSKTVGKSFYILIGLMLLIALLFIIIPRIVF